MHTHQVSDLHHTSLGTARRISLDDPSSTTLNCPGSTEVSCLLMQDTVAADVLSVGQSSSAGTLRGKVAVFANPYLDGKVEALVVDTEGNLTYLQRSATTTGWLQSRLTAFPASEVVVVVHPCNLTVWAIYTQKGAGLPVALQLVATTVDGVTTCAWQVVPDGIHWNGSPPQRFTHLSVYYDHRAPVITGFDPATGCVASIRSRAARPGFAGDVYPASFNAAPIDELVSGRVVRPRGSTDSPEAPIVYMRFGTDMIRYNPSSSGERPRTIASNVARLVGVYRSPALPDIGVVYLDTAGNLATWNEDGGGNDTVTATPGLGFVVATSWLDVNDMLHVYGIDAAGTLKVLHQASWGPHAVPVWSCSTPASKGAGANPVPSCVGLVSRVAAFGLDPFPNELPAQMVKLSGTATPDEAWSFMAQDISSALWSRDKIRLPSGGAPHLVTHYVSTVTVRDRRGAPIAALPVEVSADTLVEIQVEGASYLVGPGHAAALSTNGLGRITLATAADSLLPATLHVDAAGLSDGAIIQPAAAVHDYLGGTGTLPSQKGLFDDAALADAKIVEKGHEGSIPAVVKGSKQVFAMADGKPLTSLLYQGTGPAPRIHGFVVGPSPSALAARDARRGPALVEYRELDGPEAMAAHLEAMRSLPQYGGIWEDFANWAGDVWQGIKNGAIEVVSVAVHAVTNFFIKIGDAIVELVGMVIDTLERAARAAEAVFRQIVDSVQKVVDWLKALFAFKDIWDSRKAIQAGMTTILSYGDATLAHFGDLSAKWFESKQGEVTAYFDGLKAQYAGRPLGDAENQIPTLVDASGHGLSPRSLKDDPQANWMLNQAASRSAQEAFAAARPVLASSPIADAFDAFLEALSQTGFTEAAARIIGDIEVAVTRIVDPRDPNGGAKASIFALIDILETLTLTTLKALDGLVRAAVTLLHVVTENLGTFLDTKLDLGPVNTLYRWIQTQNGIEQPEELTLGGVFFLIAGFAVTTLYKLVRGVDSAPFPGGTFPRIAAPPWHPDHDPTRRPGDDPAENERLRLFQGALGLIGVVGGIADTMSDLIALDTSPWKAGWLHHLIAGTSVVCSGVMFGMVGSCPPVTGTGWDEAAGAWTAAFAVSCLSVVLSFGAMALNLMGKSDTPILRNLNDTTAGPCIATVLAVCSMGLAGDGCVKSQTRPYDTAEIVLANIPGMVQWARIRLTPGSGESIARACLVALIDALSTGCSAVMLCVAAFATEPPKVRPNQGLPAGRVGVPYSAKLTAYSGGQADYNRPIQNWAVQEGHLPEGLTLDAKTGAITGTPAKSGKSTFKVTCSDSFGPPQFSWPSTQSIQIT